MASAHAINSWLWRLKLRESCEFTRAWVVTRAKTRDSSLETCWVQSHMDLRLGSSLASEFPPSSLSDANVRDNSTLRLVVTFMISIQTVGTGEPVCDYSLSSFLALSDVVHSTYIFNVQHNASASMKCDFRMGCTPLWIRKQYMPVLPEIQTLGITKRTKLTMFFVRPLYSRRIYLPGIPMWGLILWLFHASRWGGCLGR